jgi:hypothetical protein
MHFERTHAFIERRRRRRRRRRRTSGVISVCMKERPHITQISFLINYGRLVFVRL